MNLNWMKLRPLYLLISGVALSLSFYSIFVWGFRYSIDFTGGVTVDYRFPSQQSTEAIKTALGINMEEAPKSITQSAERTIQLKYGPEFNQEKAGKLGASLSQALGENPEIVRFESVGPALSQEILRKTYVAVAIASLGILLWVTYQFKSLKFGVSAILAMIHDSVVLLGTFAALGHYMGVEVDILFVTAMLTILSFSVHDTIVVYDRVRESMRKHPGVPLYDLANKAVSETLVRSVNNSLTIIFMLFALFIMGGTTIKWFVAALLIGTISGTYSSPFVAVPLLVTWEELEKWWRGKKR
ncbi:MAG: protein-export membrane protein SecF [Candidatus Blackburnbacteria bacterium RIFCSPLOWO2_01_FULL_41_27]|uniref:Protein-export membrane protein SecF n=2 Tax=Candidatus Blackburniibacteriota TaxID=1817898 RepID=A0A1G1VAY8_9BACT|nr:MAG: protein-export membrane protein SecF [Candidatus Blackburnbacteria bacterium RIFCSPHIGHO2_12_FULL_41_13b]OGY13789.1 MAG: protein-export membrane protein SecF [Candidatus Blackburnbacteria bacterium RIFCSPLOWO2_01_FULL_41_27]